MAFDCNRMFRLNVLSPPMFRLFVFGILFKFRSTVDIPAVVADGCVGLLRPRIFTSKLKH